MRKRIILRGPVLSRSGYGEQSRFALRSLRKHEDRFDIYVINTQWGGTGWQAQQNEERTYIDSLIQKTFHHLQSGGKFDMSLQITIPNEWESLAPINVGYTAGIESTKIAPEWIEKCNSMDRIIVISNHAKKSMVGTSYQLLNRQTNAPAGYASVTTPVHFVGYPAKDLKKEKVKLELETDFNFLAVSQWGPRKNIQNTVLWFVDKFKDNPDVGLIVKGFVKNNSSVDRVRADAMLRSIVDPSAKCKVYLIHGDMSDEEMVGLYNHQKVKALVSLSHAEGWGLPIYEAAYSGLPVITTNWGGQCDFLNFPAKQRKKGTKNKTEAVTKPHFCEVDYTLGPIQPEAVWKGVLVEDSMWTYPEKDSYHSALDKMYKNYDHYKEMAKKLKTLVKKEYAPDKQYDAFANAVLPADKEESVVSFD
jgi:glycosyltransferase involved in cell wall biosynthesis